MAPDFYISEMLLAIDIGNTSTAIGIFDGKDLIADFRIASAGNLTTDEAGLFVTSLFNHHIKPDVAKINRVTLCSVVPRLTDVYSKMSEKYLRCNPLVISAALKLPIKIDYPKPREIGADRLANSVAGYDRYPEAQIIVDLGTATTFDVVSGEGAYIGGVIAPGPITAGANLAQKAARLFEVRPQKPKSPVGKSTAEAIRSGLYWGTIGQIDYIIDRIFEVLGGKVRVLATGGEADIFTADSRYLDEYIPTLTIEGIRLITDYQ